MKILVQTNRRNESQLTREFQKLSESGFEVVPFGYIERYASSIASTFGSDRKEIVFTGLEDIDPNEPILARTGIRLVKSLKIDNIPANIDISKTINYDVNRFKISKMPSHEIFLNLTPTKFTFIKLKVVLNRPFQMDVFFKPNDDLKLIGGTFVPKGTTLLQTLQSKNDRTLFTPEELNSQLLVSTNCPQIKEEVRCYVVNKRVVTMSRYRFENRTIIHPICEGESQYRLFARFAQHIIDNVYAPVDNFTIDICRLSDNSLRVVEYNCLTSSGLYDCNTKLLFNALKEYYYG